MPDIVTQLEILEAKLKNQGKVVRLPGSKSASPRRFYRTPVFTVILVATLTTATLASAYFNPEFRQWASEAISKIASFLKPDYSQKTGQVLVSRGNALRVKEQYKEAEFAYQTAIEKFTLKENHRGLGNVYTELGILRTRIKDYKSAKRELHKAISYFDIAEDTNGLGYASINLAQLHLVRRHFKSAKKYFLIGQKHYKAAGNQEGLGNVALGLGNLCIAKKEYPKATRHFTEAESVFQLIGNKRGLVNVYNSMSHAFQVLRTKRGKEEADQYRQLAKSIELNTNTRDLPAFSIQESFSWLTSAFNQNRDTYENEQNLKAKQETERKVR